MLSFDINMTGTNGLVRYSIKTTRMGRLENTIFDAVDRGMTMDQFLQSTIGPRARRMMLDMATGYKAKIAHIYMNVPLNNRAYPSRSSGEFLKYVLMRWGRTTGSVWPSVHVGLYPPAEKRRAMEAFELTGSSPSDYATMTEHKQSIKPWVVDKLGIQAMNSQATTKSGRTFDVSDLAGYVAGAIAKSNYLVPFQPAHIFELAKEEFADERERIYAEFLADVRNGLPISGEGTGDSGLVQ